jgi:hypothetical protein
LYEALQGFPGAEKIIRNTRCVTVHFAFMHMDVTIMDPDYEPRPPREGEIFHSPDSGASYRVRSNPFGFAKWFRKSVFFQEGVGSFAERVASRRQVNFMDRLQASEIKAADQDKLPPMIPPRFDAQQVVALKLMKRILNIEYRKQSVRRPPSIYLTKKSSDCGFDPIGLTGQLERLAACIYEQMGHSLTLASGPLEKNPVCDIDIITDRWPENQEDRRVLRAVMKDILGGLEKAKTSSFAEIAEWLTEVFGEEISTRAVRKHLERRSHGEPVGAVKVVGTILPIAAITSPAIARQMTQIPSHNFHNEVARTSNEGN